jgi:hypothetical protein
MLRTSSNNNNLSTNPKVSKKSKIESNVIETKTKKFFISIHLGAGFHSHSFEKQYLEFINSLLNDGSEMVC